MQCNMNQSESIAASYLQSYRKTLRALAAKSTHRIRMATVLAQGSDGYLMDDEHRIGKLYRHHGKSAFEQCRLYTAQRAYFNSNL